MGKKKRKDKKRNKDAEHFADMDVAEKEGNFIFQNQSVKERSKLRKKNKKKMLKYEQRNKQIGKYYPEIDQRCGYHMVCVYVKNDVNMEKGFLLSSLKNYLEQPFCPLGYFRGSDSIVFYFDADKNVADGIRSLNKRIQSPSGDLMGIKVNFVNATDFILNCDQMELLKNVILQRFNLSNFLLDLSCLHMDLRLVENNTFAPLSNEKILKHVFLFIKDMMPKVNALDLSGNKINNSCLELMGILELHSRSLSAINLENNNLKSLDCLKNLRSFPLKELKISGNNFYQENGNPSQKCIKTVKKILPFLKFLDGINLNDLTANLTKPTSFCAQLDSCSKGEIVSVTEESLKIFLEQYYTLIDTSEREKLLQAYVPTAKIELNSQNPLVPNKVFDGQSQIQEFFLLWPETKHDHTSFNLEVLNISQNEGITKVEGICLFVESQTTVQFRRIMKIIPFNSGFCCIEDFLHIL